MPCEHSRTEVMEVSVDKRTLKLGQKLVIQVTGMVGNHAAVVIGHDQLEGQAVLQITDDPSWSEHPLKRDDYIVIEVVGDGEGEGK